MGPDWMVGLGSPKFDISARLPQGSSKNQVPEMIQMLLADRFKLVTHRGSKRQQIYALVVAVGGLKVEAAAPVLDAPANPDAPPPTTGFFGAVETHTTPDGDGSGVRTTITNPRMGTVRETDLPRRIQRWEAPAISFSGLADLLDRVAPLSSPIVDMTGGKGRYRVVLEVSLNDLSLSPPPLPADSDPAAMEHTRTEMEEAVLRAFNDGLRRLGLQLVRRRGPVETLVVDHVEKTPTGN